MSDYKFVDRKIVYDSDGFTTEYTWYKDTNTGNNVFVFGDSDLYTPEDGDFDWETESDVEAKEWFDDYEGFTDDDTWEVEEEDLKEDMDEDSWLFDFEGYHICNECGKIFEGKDTCPYCESTDIKLITSDVEDE